MTTAPMKNMTTAAAIFGAGVAPAVGTPRMKSPSPPHPIMTAISVTMPAIHFSGESFFGAPGSVMCVCLMLATAAVGGHPLDQRHHRAEDAEDDEDDDRAHEQRHEGAKDPSALARDPGGEESEP